MSVRRVEPRPRPLPVSGVVRVGLLGLGVVGAGVAEILTRHRRLIAERVGVELRVVRALVRRPSRRRHGAAGKVPVTRDPAEIIEATDVDVVTELLGGLQPARDFIRRAAAAGKPVVTANKAVLAAHGAEIFSGADRAGTDVYFEGAVAGGVPIIRTLREGLASDRITRLTGILNGTTNYILEAMETGAAYDAVLGEAQRLGFAEADPTLDVTGRDAADKLAILTQLAYGTRVRAEDIPTEGITGLTPEILDDARELGYRVKLLAISKRVKAGKKSALDIRVHPTFVPARHPLSTVPAAQNAIALVSDALGPTLYQGAGAGGLPTGSAVVSDLIEAARNLRAGIAGRLTVTGAKAAPKPLPVDDAVSAFYLRLSVQERPGVLAAVARILAQHRISLGTVLQRERGVRAGQPVPVVIITHPTPFGPMRKALVSIARHRSMRGPPSAVRIEDAP